MADFCRQCSIEVWGEDFGDLANLGPKDYRALEPDEGWAALCEHCGPTLVNNAGECLPGCCLVDHAAAIARRA